MVRSLTDTRQQSVHNIVTCQVSNLMDTFPCDRRVKWRRHRLWKLSRPSA